MVASERKVRRASASTRSRRASCLRRTFACHRVRCSPESQTKASQSGWSNCEECPGDASGGRHRASTPLFEEEEEEV